MSAHKVLLTAVADLLVIAGLAAAALPPAWAQAPPGSSLRVALPFDLVDTLDGAKFKIRVPANWNGTLLIYIQGTKSGPQPAEPRLVPAVLPGSDPPLEGTLLSQGYALAASEISPADWQIKAGYQDTLALAAYFRGRIGEPRRVVLWGTTIGGLTALRLLEDCPRSFDAAIAMAVPGSGTPRRQDQSLDFALAYAVAFGWREDVWGPLESLRPDLNFTNDVAPLVNWPKEDGSNRGGWEFIRLVTGWAPDAFWKLDPLFGYPGYLLKMNFSIQDRVNTQNWAAGPVAQNLDHRYSLTADDKKYLAGLGVQADDLLAKMNARTNIAASAVARDYIARFGELHGTLTKPVLNLYTTLDTIVDVRHASAYLKTVDFWSRQDYLAQAYAATIGHYAFTARQLFAALIAMENWLDTGKKPGAAAFPEALGFDNAFVPLPWPY